MKLIRKPLVKKCLAHFLSALVLISSNVIPNKSYAISGGVDQNEHASGSSSSVSQMVDLASGNFSYSIPLMDVEGYPLNLNYSAGIGMEQEASWVGLGWTLSPGAVSRTVRGLPDDFKGDEIERKMTFKDDVTFGVYISGGVEITGKDKKDNKPTGGKKKKKKKKKNDDKKKKKPDKGLNASFGVFSNTYRGLGIETSVSLSMDIANKISPGISLSNNTQSGIDVTPNLSFQGRSPETASGWGVDAKISFGLPINSREGIRGVSVSKSLSATKVVRTVPSNKGTGKRDLKEGFDIASSSSILPFGTQSFVPESKYKRNIDGYTLDLGVGGEVNWGYIKGAIKASKVTQGIADTEWGNPSYGYLYSEFASDNGLMDFNREFAGMVTPDDPRLPFTAMMPDAFSASAEGLSVNFRAHRSDIGRVHEPELYESNGKGNTSAQYGFGDVAKAGVDHTHIEIENKSGKYENTEHDQFDFLGWKSFSQHANSNDERHDVETYQFRVAGDMGIVQNEIIIPSTSGDDLGGYDPVSPNMVSYGSYLKKDGTTDNYSSSSNHDYEKESNRPRNYAVTALDAKEASINGLERVIKNYDSFEFTNSSLGTELEKAGKVYTDYTGISRNSVNPYQEHHLHEYSITNTKGVRYVYSLPTYSKVEKEVSFSVDDPLDNNDNVEKINYKTGKIDYDPGQNSLSNMKGESQTYNEKLVPAHATNILLSAVLSSDYVDVTGDGPTPDDIGTYTKFNYSKIDGYKWRNPFCKDELHPEAFFNPMSYFSNIDGTPDGDVNEDGMASYVYGEKELWYLHSVESKNYVAEFVTSKRDDGFGVAGENGGKGSVELLRLDKINLFTRAQKIEEADPIPIKTVHFTYDYSLCPGVSNNKNNIPSNTDAGKLTLKSVHSTSFNSKYEDADKNKYEFVYGDSDHDISTAADLNEGYDSQSSDRWGMFLTKPSYLTIPASSKHTSILTNKEFPYTNQDRAITDKAAGMWCLSGIKTPTGAVIEVDYEADSYAFVQNRPAMKMFPIVGMSDIPLYSSASSTLYSDSKDELTNKNYLWIDLSGDPIAAPNQSDAKVIFENLYLKKIEKNLYFKAFTNFSPDESGVDDNKDFVQGYIGIDRSKTTLISSSTSTAGVYDKVALYINPVNMGDKGSSQKIHPISKAGFELATSYLNAKINPAINPNSTNISDMKIFEQILDDMKNLLQGRNHTLMKRKIAKKLVAARSYVRLYTNKEKLGGGHRVKKITISDSWESFDDYQENVVTGYSYDYSRIDGTTSGVNTYEPLAGGADNPYKSPERYVKRRVLSNNSQGYMEKPFGEFVLPNPGIVYSRVVVRPIEYASINDHSIGHEVHEYFTALDYPIGFANTSIQPTLLKPNFIEKIFQINSSMEFKASQGFAIYLNDMHGKKKSEAKYRGKELEKELIVSTIYDYTLDEDNKHLTCDRTGALSPNTQTFGKDLDIAFDSRYSYTKTTTSHAKANVDFSPAGGFPLVLGLPFWMKSHDERTFSSASISKIVSTYGILKKTTVNNGASDNVIENKYLDEDTKLPIRVYSSNSYGDGIIENKIPAYYVHSGMGLASLNEGITVFEIGVNDVISGFDIISPDYVKYFHPGDEVLIYNLIRNEYIEKKFWVIQLDDDMPNDDCPQYALVDRFGLFFFRTDIYNGNATGQDLLKIKITRSGRRNILEPLAESYTSKQNTANTAYNDMFFTNSSSVHEDALSATANFYSEKWRTHGVPINPTLCPFDYSPISDRLIEGGEMNPYVYGTRGNWRLKESCVPYVVNNQNRKVTSTQTLVNLDNSGVFEHKPCWTKLTTGLTYDKGYQEWLRTANIRTYNTNGTPMEAINEMDQFQTIKLGYNSTLPEAVFYNSNGIYALSEDFEDNVYKYQNHLIIDNPYDNDPAIKVVVGQDENINRKFFEFVDGIAIPSDEFAHTGKQSLKIFPSSSIVTERTVGQDIGSSTALPQNFIDGDCATPILRDEYPLTAEKEDLWLPFSFKEAEVYILSFWIKEGNDPVSISGSTVTPIKNYSALDILPWAYDLCSSTNQSVSYFKTYTSPIVDGWQKVEYSISSDQIASTYKIALELKNTSSSNNLYIDDIRLYPYHSEMVTTVYDNLYLRPMATMDNRNFATFYVYDEHGSLISTKKETVQGIFSVSESRTALKKK